MNPSAGLSRPIPSVPNFVFYGLSRVALAVALRWLDLGIASAIRAGTGTALIAVIRLVCFKEPVTLVEPARIGLIVAGVAGPNPGGTAHS